MVEGFGSGQAPPAKPSRHPRFLLALDSLLTRQRLVAYPAILLLAWGLAYLAVAFASQHWEPLPDFASRWTAGRMVLQGDLAHLYDPAAQSAIQGRELGASALSWFVSPPFVALLFAPFAAMPFGLACLAWAMLLLFLLFAAGLLTRPFLASALGERWRWALVIAGSSAPVLEALGSGQDTVVVLVAMVGGIHLLRRRRDTLAGVVMGLGLIKPHLVFLVPLVLLLQGRIRGTAAFLVTGLCFGGVSWWLVGSQGIEAWLALPSGSLYATEVTSGQAWKSTSLAAFLTSLAPSPALEWARVAMVLALMSALPTLIFLVRRRREMSGCSMWSLALLTTAVASPHFMLYDLILCLPIIGTLVVQQWDAVTRVLLSVTYVLLWLMGPLHLIGVRLGWPWSLVAAPWAAVGVLFLWSRFSRGTLSASPGMTS